MRDWDFKSELGNDCRHWSFSAKGQGNSRVASCVSCKHWFERPHQQVAAKPLEVTALDWFLEKIDDWTERQVWESPAEVQSVLAVGRRLSLESSLGPGRDEDEVEAKERWESQKLASDWWEWGEHWEHQPRDIEAEWRDRESKVKEWEGRQGYWLARTTTEPGYRRARDLEKEVDRRWEWVQLTEDQCGEDKEWDWVHELGEGEVWVGWILLEDLKLLELHLGMR